MELQHILLASFLTLWPLNFILLLIWTRVFGYKLPWQFIALSLFFSFISVWIMVWVVISETFSIVTPRLNQGLQDVIEAVFGKIYD
jgi:hypothetical protein